MNESNEFEKKAEFGSDDTIDFIPILKTLWKKLWLILLLSCLIAGGARK